jgi:precorrin-6B methylase 1
MIRGATTPDTGEGGVAGAGGLQADTSAAPANAIAMFERDNSPREDIQRLLSLGMRTSPAIVMSDLSRNRHEKESAPFTSAMERFSLAALALVVVANF